MTPAQRPPVAFHVAIVLAMAALAAGCEGLIACTDAGCGDTIRVTVDGGPPEGDYTLVLTAPGEEPLSVLCTAPGVCFAVPPRSDFTPAELTITYDAGDTTIVRHFTPDYETYRPNGRGCSPTCRRADVRFVID